MKCESIFKLIIFILGTICFLTNIFLLLFYRHYFSSEALEILFYISFGLVYCLYLFILFMELPIKNNTINKFRKKCTGPIGKCVIFIIFFIIILFELIILSFMADYNSEYWKNCPFTISEHYKLHSKRRCELYNLNSNSRFSNQYICSYNPDDDFKYEYKRSGKHSHKVPKKLRKKIEPDYVRCVMVKNLIPNNNIITLFNNEYENIDKYYCSRTNKPKKNSLINDKDCNNKVKHVFMYILYGFNFLKFFFIVSYVIYLPKIDYYIYKSNRNNIIINNNRNYNNNLNNNINDNNNNNYINKNGINSTKGSEDINKNDNNVIGFNNNETKNIIIDNKEEIHLENNIREYPYNNENDMKNNNLDNSKQSSSFMKNNEVQNKNPYDDIKL